MHGDLSYEVVNPIAVYVLARPLGHGNATTMAVNLYNETNTRTRRYDDIDGVYRAIESQRNGLIDEGGIGQHKCARSIQIILGEYATDNLTFV